MADAPDQSHGRTSFDRSAKTKVNPAAKAKRSKCLALKSKYRSKKRARVDIGYAFESWRELKEVKGLGSDAEVAQCLLNEMKRMLCSPTSAGASNEKMKFSKYEVRALIEQEVHCAMKTNESKLQGLIETIQQLDQAVDYESTIQKLEARINNVTQRSEEALSYMQKKKKKNKLKSLRADFKDDTMETESEIDTESKDCTDNKGDLCHIMETTKKALNKMQADNKALTATIEDIRGGLSPPVLSLYGSPESKVLKEEPKDCLEKEYSTDASMPSEESRAESVKGEMSSPEGSASPKCTESKQPNHEALYLPLPPTDFPSILNMEAASYNIPQKPMVRLALIRNPPSLSVLWNLPEKDPYEPPLESYSVLMTMEKAKGSGVFSNWSTVGEVKPIPPPICVMISKYKPGRKVCVAVVGKDKFGRYGPYSDVVTATIPD